MKAKLRARVLEVVKNTEVKDGNVVVASMTKLKLHGKGKVETTPNLNAQLTLVDGEFFLREVVANQMKIGATLTITLTDEDESDSEIE